MKQFDKIVIYGLGLLGASLAKVIKKQNLAKTIVGISQNEQTKKYALGQHIFDEVFSDIQEVDFLKVQENHKGQQKNSITSNCLIILCTPIEIILKQLEDLSRFIFSHPFFSSYPPLITDVGSTKESIVQKAKELSLFSFVGCHPLAGSEKNGIEHSDIALFKNKICFVCTDHQSKYYQIVVDFWESIEMKVIPIVANLHDKALANSSHLPHLLSTLLTKINFAYQSQQQQKIPIYGSGFLDMTRLAKGNEKVWLDIVKNNSQAICNSLTAFSNEVEQLIALIEQKNWQKIEKTLKEARNYRQSIE